MRFITFIITKVILTPILMEPKDCDHFNVETGKVPSRLV
jgi:hypothetical protein